MNSAKDIARTKAWVKNNPERSRAIKKRYKILHREKVAVASRLYVQRKRATATPEQKEQRRAYDRAWYRKTYSTSVNHRLKVNLRARLYKALKGIAKWKRTEELLGSTIDSFKIYLESRFEPEMSWENYGNKAGQWNVDHIIPCTLFDLSKPEHQRRCFHYSNMTPMWAPENTAKSNKLFHRHEGCLNL